MNTVDMDNVADIDTKESIYNRFIEQQQRLHQCQHQFDLNKQEKLTCKFCYEDHTSDEHICKICGIIGHKFWSTNDEIKFVRISVSSVLIDDLSNIVMQYSCHEKYHIMCKLCFNMYGKNTNTQHTCKNIYDNPHVKAVEVLGYDNIRSHLAGSCADKASFQKCVNICDNFEKNAELFKKNIVGI